ncbi:MAG: DUF1570 domain-containing protein, partial [Bryobacterales bacterium]|nr:DUF1570 domain-containing protein [Bryobacterales bacterium]
MRILALVLIFGNCAPAKWLKLESGPFTVLTDAGEKTGRETMERIERARQAFAFLAPRSAGLPLPVTVYALVSEAKFAAVQPGPGTRGFYQSAPLRDFIVVRAGPEYTRILLHEYVHMVLHHTTGPLPKWLEEGLAEFYSTLDISDRKLRLGRPVESHVALLARLPWLPASELAAVNRDSRVYDEASRASVFYAQSWALVHLLRLGENYRANFHAFLTAMASGESLPAAFQQVFGQSFSDVFPELKRYLDRGAFPVVEYSAAIDPVQTPAAVTPLSDVEADLAFAELAHAGGHSEEAARIYQRLGRRAKENSPEIARALGLLALAGKRTAEAKQHFESAMQAQTQQADVYFEYAMLLRDQGAPREVFLSHLRKALAVNPNYAEAQFLTGSTLQTSDQHAAALPHLERAASIFPRQSYFWHALAVSYLAVGRTADSRNAASRALDSATTPEQAEMARAALNLETSPRASAPKKQDVVVPDSWRKSEGDTKVSGVLERIDCLGEPARFVVRAGGRSIPLLV